MNTDDRQRLAAAAQAARENNETLEMTDADNRHWFVGYETADNHAVILLQARRGQEIHEVRLSTATFSPALVDEAIATIDGDFK